MMDWQTKLIGDEGERAVSPVIGVILMVAITVILAAVIAAFVLDMGSGMDENANAGVAFDVDTESSTITVSASTMGNSERVELRGDVTDEVEDITGVGESVELSLDDDLSGNSGTVTAVAMTEDGTETQVSSQDYDFSGTATAEITDDGDGTATVDVTDMGDANELTISFPNDNGDTTSSTGTVPIDPDASGEITVVDDAGTEIASLEYTEPEG